MQKNNEEKGPIGETAAEVGASIASVGDAADHLAAGWQSALSVVWVGQRRR